MAFMVEPVTKRPTTVGHFVTNVSGPVNALVLPSPMPEMPFAEFYARLVDAYHGSEVENRPGFRPRGAFTEGKPGGICLMLVLLNPGQPHPTEAAMQGDAIGAELARIVWKSSGQAFKGEPPFASPTMRVLRDDVVRLLRRPFAECAESVMLTNLVRCTTEENRPPGSEAVAIGAEFLKEEIALWRPDKVVAFGNRPALGMLSHAIRVDAMLPHPAAVGKWLSPGLREARVEEIRKRLALG